MGAKCCSSDTGGKDVILACSTSNNGREAQPPVMSRCNEVASCSTIAITAEKDSKGMTNHKLLCASRDGNVDGMRQAIAEGAYLETRRPFVMRPKPNAFGMEAKLTKKGRPREGLTPLMYTVQNGSVEGTRLLLEAGALVNARDEDGFRPLHFAAAAGAPEVCELLISHGAERDLLDDEGRRPLEHVPEDCLATRPERVRWEAQLGSRVAKTVPSPSQAQLGSPPEKTVSSPSPAPDPLDDDLLCVQVGQAVPMPELGGS